MACNQTYLVMRQSTCRTGSLPIRSMKPLNSETADLEATCGRIRFVSRSFGARVQSPRPESAVFSGVQQRCDTLSRPTRVCSTPERRDPV